jgi:hypothetical protein
MPSMSDENVGPEVIDGIRSLHERIDELHRLVTQRLETEGVHTAGEWVHTHAGTALHAARAIPAWQRRTQGELRWPVTLTTAVAVALQLAVPDRLVLVHPSWVLPAVQGLLLIVLVTANPHRIDRQSRLLRLLALTFAALLSLANGWSLARLAIGITQATTGTTPARLLVSGAMIWLTNVVVFALWYWEFDRGGPVSRALNVKRYPDFQFVQMISPPEMVPPDWEPRFVDYLYLALTNAAAFSPTDVMPLSRWAKIAMAAQSLVSIVTVALVVSRAVNILQLSSRSGGCLNLAIGDRYSLSAAYVRAVCRTVSGRHAYQRMVRTCQVPRYPEQARPRLPLRGALWPSAHAIRTAGIQGCHPSKGHGRGIRLGRCRRPGRPRRHADSRRRRLSQVVLTGGRRRLRPSRFAVPNGRSCRPWCSPSSGWGPPQSWPCGGRALLPSRALGTC